MEQVNARWMQRQIGFLHGIKWIIFHGHLDYFQKPPLEGRPNNKTNRPWHPKISQPLIYVHLSFVRTPREQFIEIASS